MKIDFSKLYLIPRESIANAFFYASMLLAFFSSMNVWFLLPIATFFPIMSFILGLSAFIISRPLDKQIFCSSDALFPTIAFIILLFYQAVVNDNNVNTYIKALFNSAVLYIFLKYDKQRLGKFSDILAKTLGGILLVSYPIFLLYLIGFPLPYSDLDFNDGFYYFSNYYFFLIDERSLFSIIPRFQSIFLEPTYLGSTTALLLMTQRGKWKRWYNVSMLFGLFISFSLAGYAYIFAITFLNLWTNREKIVKKVVIAFTVIVLGIAGAFFYNGGDNLVHDLILLRLEMNDGEMEGNNRVTKSFDNEYDGYVQTTDIILGRDYDYSSFGDSGYKVYIYDYGLVGTLLLFTFYFFLFRRFSDARALTSACIILLLIWGVDAFVLWFGRMIPLYITAIKEKETTTEYEHTDRLHSLPA